MTRSTLRALLAALVLGLLPPDALAQTVVADVVRVVATVTAQAPGADPRTLQAGDPVYLGDRLVTGSGALLEIAFRDGTRFTLGSSTEMTVKAYSAPESAEPSFLAEVTRGVFRVLTGLIARKRPGAVRFVTPTATIGIRGTHFGGETDGARAVIVLLEPEDEDRAAIEVSNAYGAVTIDEPGYGTEIPDARSPPSPPRRMRLRAVDNLMRSLSTIQRMQPPRMPR
ncbi:MAG: FecR family protein [Burkholderiales bacterium]|nr:FecR family protein [Burkholderiales bacterium]